MGRAVDRLGRWAPFRQCTQGEGAHVPRRSTALLQSALPRKYRPDTGFRGRKGRVFLFNIFIMRSHLRTKPVLARYKAESTSLCRQVITQRETESRRAGSTVEHRAG